MIFIRPTEAAKIKSYKKIVDVVAGEIICIFV